MNWVYSDDRVHFSFRMNITELTPDEVENTTTGEQQMRSILTAFSDISLAGGVNVPPDYLEYSIKAMKRLKESGRSNVLYSLARSLATPRSNGTGSKFPTTRMPMGLLEYIVHFFDAETLQDVSCSFRCNNKLCWTLIAFLLDSTVS